MAIKLGWGEYLQSLFINKIKSIKILSPCWIWCNIDFSNSKNIKSFSQFYNLYSAIVKLETSFKLWLFVMFGD